MEPEVQAKPVKRGRKNIVLVSLLVFSLLMLAAAAQLTFMTLKNDRMYKGVFVNNLDASGMTREELAGRLAQDYQDRVNKTGIELKAGKVSEKSSFKDLKVSYDVEAAVEKAYAVGRTGNIFERLGEIISTGGEKTVIELPVSFDSAKLNGLVDKLYNNTLVPVEEPGIQFEGDKAVLTTGHHGESIDKAAVLSKLQDEIRNRTSGIVDAELKVVPPAKINVDDLYAKLNKEPQNASFKVADGNVEIIPHVVGSKIDRAVLANAVAELEGTENARKVLPVEVTMPALTTDAANAGLFRDVIGTWTTHFSTNNENNKNRGTNIRLAAAKINGIVLLPGDVFSFNGAVGPRTAEGGYQTAHTYISGKVVDGLGGGICQVSSTLYNAVLKADLGIVERRNHMFTVGYVPYGQDATVSFGSTDFRFQNNTNWPIKVSAGVSKNNNITFTLTGTNETPGKKVIISNQTIKTIPFTTKYTDDPTLPEGTTKVKQEGENGYIIDTFKTVKIGEKVVSQGKLYTSKYIPLTEEILKGTKKAAGSTTPTTPPPAETGSGVTTGPEQPTQPDSGVDDADNPPAPPVDEADNPPAAQ